MNRLSKTEFAIFVPLMCSLLPENLYSELILSSLKPVLCLVAAVKCLPVHHHSVDYTFWSFGILGPILSEFENRVPLMAVLGVGTGWAVLHHSITVYEQTQ